MQNIHSEKIRNTPRRFKPIGAIIRTAKGEPIGRVLRHERAGQVEAFARGGLRSLGRFDTERAARLAIRAKHEARRR